VVSEIIKQSELMIRHHYYLLLAIKAYYDTKQ